MQIILESWPIEKIEPYPLNAKVHTEEQINSLANAISKFGWDQPIVLDKHGVIIKGHGRRLAAIKLGLEEVPVVVREDLTDEQAKAARISDNQTALGDIDDDALLADLKELFSVETDFSLTDLGFSEDDDIFEALGSALSDAELGDIASLGNDQGSSESSEGSSSESLPAEVDYTAKFEVVVECKSEADQEEVYEIMAESGRKCRILSM